MSVLVPILVLGIDAVLVAWVASVGVCATGLHRRGLVEGMLGWLLLALAWIAGSGVLLGMFGGLGRNGFLAIHAAGAVVALVACRRMREDFQASVKWAGEWWRLWRSGAPEGYVAAGLVLTLATLGLLAAQAEPATYDAVTYRLPRIGAWLQDGWIQHFSTDDPRLNYMPVAPDVIIAWLLGGSDAGYRLAPVPQLAGCVLLVGATFGLARLVGLSRLQAFGAVGLLLGMGNVAAQLTTIQTDLFTAGVFAASYVLWHRAWLRGEGSWVAGIGVALAFASKGTMFYLAPGAAIWVGWLLWQARRPWRALVPTALGLAGALLLLAAPAYWRNHTTYGSIFGPRDAIVMHHGSFDSPVQHADKLVRNLGTSAVQLFEPTAQPLWLAGASRAMGEKLAGRLSAEADPYVFIGQSRRDQVQRVMRLAEPDADVITCGLIAAGLFSAGLARALVRRKDPVAMQVLVWSAGVLVYLCTQHALVQWHHWAFRFVVLAAPWMAVAAAWALTALGGKLRFVAWSIVLASAGQVFLLVQAQASQAAWRAATQPERSAGYFHYRHWRAWAAQLDHPREPLTLALPIDRALAAFQRLDPPRRVELRRLSGLEDVTAEAAVGKQPGWLVVPVERFEGREGRVMGVIGPLGIAAYRALQPGEHPRPMIYGNQLIGVDGGLRRLLVVRTWADAPVRIELFNPAPNEVHFELRTPSGHVAGSLAAGGRRTWEIPVPPDVLAAVTIDFPRGPAQDVTTTAIMVRLAP